MKKIFGVFFTIFLILGLALGLTFWQNIADYVRANSVEKSPEIVQISQKIGLKDGVKNIFFATNPQILGRENFSKHCKNLLEKTSVLGCYKNSSTLDDEIFLFDVEDAELDGIREATAAHELLHAVWARTSSGKRADLSEKLRAEYERLKTPKLEKTMAGYAISQPGEHENELHSILATEFEQLSPELEQYYATIFDNRQAVVAFFKKYNSKFEELEQKSQNLSTEIETLKKEIDAEKDDLSAKMDNLNSQIGDFNARAQSGDFSSQAEFSAERAGLVRRSDFLTEYRQQINAKIDNFNAKIAELGRISLRSQKLYKAINSNLLQTSPSL